jgi:hypothetical protein
MDKDTFATAVNGLSALPTEIREHLLALNEQLTDEERKNTIEQLTPLNAEAEQKQKEAEVAMDKEEEKMNAFEKDVLPELQQVAEEQEQSSAEDILKDV